MKPFIYHLWISRKQALLGALVLVLVMQSFLPLTVYAQSVGVNTAPTAPQIVSNQQSGIPNTSYTFGVRSTDYENDQISYGFDWDNDGVVDEYTAFTNSGDVAQIDHSWPTVGLYNFSVSARDQWGAFSSPVQGSINISAQSTGSNSVVNTAPTGLTINTNPTGFVNTAQQFIVTASDLQNDQISYGFDWDNDGVVDQWTSFVQSGSWASASYDWNTAGTYTINVFAKDSFGNISPQSVVSVTINNLPVNNAVVNTAPITPTVVASPSGIVNTIYSFSAASTDSQNDQISYGFDWDNNGVVDQWTSFFPSGTEVTMTNSWPNAGTYAYKVSAKDPYGLISVPFTGSITINNQTSGSGNSSGGNGSGSGNSGSGNNQTAATISSYSLNSSVITSGNTVTVSWYSPNAYQCIASGAWGGTLAASGSQVVGPFTTGSVSSVQTFTITCSNSLGSSVQSLNLTIDPVSTGNSGNTSGNTGGNTGNVTNPSVAGGFTLSTTSGFTTKIGGAMTFTVVLTSAPSANVIIPISSSDFNEGTTTPNFLTFTPANWNSSQMVTVTGQNDGASTTNSIYSVTVGPSQSTDTYFNAISAQILNITNNGVSASSSTSTNNSSNTSSSGGSSTVVSVSPNIGTSGGGGGTYTGPCIGYNCPSNHSSTVSSAAVQNDVWILIDTIKSGSVGPNSPELVCPSVNFITSFLRKGIDNNPNEVRKLQYFLNTYEGANLTVDGEFGTSTETAVKAFQVKYSNDVLAPWGTTTPTGIVYITTSRKINYIYCKDHPTYAGNADIKDIIDNNLPNLINPANTGQFQNVIGSAATTSPNIAGVFGGLSQRVLDALEGIPIYQLLILLLLLLGIGFTIQGTIIKDTPSYKIYATMMRGLGVLTIASVLNVLNTLSFMLNPLWLTSKTGLTLSWVLVLDMFNAVSMAAICISVLIAIYGRLSKLEVNK